MTGKPAPVARARWGPERAEAGVRAGSGQALAVRVEGDDERSGSSESWRALPRRFALCPNEIIPQSRVRAPESL